MRMRCRLKQLLGQVSQLAEVPVFTANCSAPSLGKGRKSEGPFTPKREFCVAGLRRVTFYALYIVRAPIGAKTGRWPVVAANYPNKEQGTYNSLVASGALRPGPKKVQRLPIGSRRTCEFVQSIDYSWQQLFEKADVVSEGAVRVEAEGRVYYGSTSVLLATAVYGGVYANADLDALMRLVESDPHARVRAVRVACLEAQLRARQPIGAIRAELTIRRDSRGIRIDIDIEAPVIGELHSTRSATRRR